MLRSTSPAVSLGEERGLLSRTAADNRAYMSLCQPMIWSMAAMLRDSVIVVVRTHPRAIPQAMITMKKTTHGFPFVSIYGLLMGLRLAALRSTGAPLFK